MSLINKIDHAKVLNLTEQIPLDDDQVNSRTLVQRDDLSMTLFSVATDQEIGGHSAQGRCDGQYFKWRSGNYG